MRGVALVIVLAFVVLLTGLIIAFFSRAISERQISNSSANGIRVDVFAQGALTTVLGDLRQEIAAGSTQPFPNPATGTYLYYPKTPQAAVPSLAGTTTSDNLPNLVKRSAYNQKFYTNPSGTTTYDTSTYPPADRAANSSSISGSQNGRTVSPARWNKVLLLPKQNSSSDTDFTPVNATATSWSKAPDWIVVARDGTNPTAWNSALAANGTNPAAGRFAYNIYDEGGLLDANVVGYPTDATVPSPQANFPAYKKTTAFADLKQLPGFSDLPAARQEQLIRTLAGWRNFASTGIDPTTANPLAGSPVSGSVTAGYTWSSTNILDYLNFVNLNGTGFLRSANPVLVGGQSDRFIASRQQLISLLLNSMANQDSSATAERAALQNALQYLGTFSRALNQPSYVRLQSTNSASTLDYNSAVPKILSAAAGGNDASGGDDKINPSFPLIRVTTSFTRNDNVTIANVGEPLVKKRFPLIDLAWLTYAGPSHDAGTAAQTALLNAGVSQTIINQGTAANIAMYFGLQWTGNQWKYIHGTLNGSGPIMTLSKVAAAGREPDFFELLKASVNAGSLAKSYATPGGTALAPTGYQAQRDTSVDAAVIQMGANMIDQFDTDSYPTSVVFNDGSLFGGKDQTYRGIEDLPYIYRVREGKIMITDSTPSQYSLPQTPVPAGFAPGDGVVLQEPEIWNPHGWNGTTTSSSGRPTNFQLVAVSTDPNGVSTSNILPWPKWRMYAPTGSSAVTSNPTPPTVGTALSSSLQFQIPSGRLDLFREPTLLLKTNVPAGSNLSGGTAIHAVYPAGQYTLNSITDDLNYLGIVLGHVPMAWTGTVAKDGIMIGNPAVATTGAIPAGFVYYPLSNNGITWRLQYQDATGTYVTYDEKFSDVVFASSYNTPNNSGDSSGTPEPNYLNKTWGRSTSAAYSDQNIGSEFAEVCFDPRTSRFGMIYQGRNGPRGNAAEDFPVSGRNTYTAPSPTRVYGTGWSAAFPAGGSITNATLTASASQNALLTCRPDENQGFIFSTYDAIANGYAYNTGPTAGGWYPTATATASSNSGAGTTAVIRPGMTVQNDPDTASATSLSRFAGDSNAPPVPANQYYADADGVVRRGMSAFVAANSPPASGQPSGLPMKAAMTVGSPSVPNSSTNEYASRPIVLNRPFRSVAELGYVFSGTPWKNLDFSTPESGDVAMLDVFCINDTDDPNGLVAGKVDLNTRQGPVLKAILSGAYKDEFNPSGSTSLTWTTPLSSAEATTIGTDASLGVPAWTTSTATGKGPMVNVSDLVGRWQSSSPILSSVYGKNSYSGFIGTNLSAALTSATDIRVARFREASVRALAANGQTRVWNLLIDLVAQTGRYPTGVTSLDKFAVEGEQRYWLHLAIDRVTGQVVDRQLELVKE